MGKNMTKSSIKKKKKLAEQRRRKTLRLGVLSLLVVLGLGMMVGMAMLNANARPQRDMKWYVRDADVQVAAPAMGNGYAAAGQRGNANGPALADIKGDATPRPTIKPTIEPSLISELPQGHSASGATGDNPGQGSDEDANAAFDELTSNDAQLGDIEVAPEGDGSTVMLKITAAGDCTFGGEMGSKGRRRFVELANKEGFDYFFDGVRQVFEDDDLTIVNLEGPLTDEEKTNKHGFVFKGDPRYVNILTGSSVELCNLANNHTMDYGKAGLKDTVNALDASGVGFCGYSKVFNTTIRGVRVSAVGFTWWDNDKKQILQTIAQARENCDLLIANIHWGVEGNTMQDHRQAVLAHAMVDAGADLVIGTHPHVYQGIEKYKGKYIVYSLGNFCFAGNANPADKRCFIFQQTFSFNPGMGIARANIMDAGINIIPCTISSVKELNDFQPTIMEAKEGAAMLQAVASHSTKFSLTNSLWMRDNYPVTVGLVGGEEDAQAQQPVAADIEAEQPESEAGEENPEQQAGEELNTL